MAFEKVDDMASFFKVIGDPTRVKILYTLRYKEHCVSEIANLLNISPSAVSHQLAKLKHFRLIKGRREGKEIFYSLDDEHILQIFDLTLTHLSHH